MDEYYQIHIARYRQILDSVNSLHLQSSAKVLDIGCYPPHIFNELEKRHYQVFGISSSHEQVKHSQVKVCNLETEPIPFPNNNFDLAIFTEVFEHLYSSPQKVITEIYRCLKPGGYLFFTTPNVLRLQNVINLVFGKNIYFPIFQLDQPLNFRHNREYTQKEIVQIMTESKFKIIKATYTISYPPFRQRNQNDPIHLKFIKYLNYFFSSLIPSRRDTLFFLVQKPL